MQTWLVGTIGSLVALVGFAGWADASATVDLIWAQTGTDTISSVASSDTITLGVFVTAGAAGVRSPISGTSIFNGATLVNIPEPGTASLRALGLGGLVLASRRRKTLSLQSLGW